MSSREEESSPSASSKSASGDDAGGPGIQGGVATRLLKRNCIWTDQLNNANRETIATYRVITVKEGDPGSDDGRDGRDGKMELTYTKNEKPRT